MTSSSRARPASLWRSAYPSRKIRGYMSSAPARHPYVACAPTKSTFTCCHGWDVPCRWRRRRGPWRTSGVKERLPTPASPTCASTRLRPCCWRRRVSRSSGSTACSPVHNLLPRRCAKLSIAFGTTCRADHQTWTHRLADFHDIQEWLRLAGPASPGPYLRRGIYSPFPTSSAGWSGGPIEGGTHAPGGVSPRPQHPARVIPGRE